MDPWAGCATSDALMSKWFGAGTALTNRIDLEFASPTVFKRQGLMFVLPLPQLVWGSYLAAWNEFASPGFDLKALTTLEHDVQISRYQLRTRAVKGQTISQPSESARETIFKFGFVGRCAYTIFRPERALWRTLHLLADFSFFCGTGYKTTQGMGQTRRVERPPTTDR
jgi:CRISPR-associated endoribonuclease Cas6